MQRGDRRARGLVGEEDGGEVVVGDACPVEGAVESVAAGDLLGGDMLFAGVACEIDLRAGVGLRIVLIAEAAGPRDESADGRAVAGDDDISVKYVGLVEGEGLGDVNAVGRVVEGKFAGSGDIAGSVDGM